MEEVLSRGIVIQISYINHPAIPHAWIGRVLDRTLLAELTTISKETGIDLAGENGEYHTMTVKFPESFEKI